MADQVIDMDRFEKLIGVKLDEGEQARVKVYAENAQKAIMVYIKPYLDGDVFPDELSFIVDDLVLSKFNRFHNEGMDSVSEEGLTLNFRPNELADYLPAIQAWIDATGNDSDQQGDAIGW